MKYRNIPFYNKYYYSSNPELTVDEAINNPTKEDISIKSSLSQEELNDMVDKGTLSNLSCHSAKFDKRNANQYVIDYSHRTLLTVGKREIKHMEDYVSEQDFDVYLQSIKDDFISTIMESFKGEQVYRTKKNNVFRSDKTQVRITSDFSAFQLGSKFNMWATVYDIEGVTVDEDDYDNDHGGDTKPYPATYKIDLETFLREILDKYMCKYEEKNCNIQSLRDSICN